MVSSRASASPSAAVSVAMWRSHVAMASSRNSTWWGSCARRKRLWAVTRPVSASPRAARLRRSRRWASSASSSGVPAGEQRLEPRARRHPEDVGDDTGERDVRGLEDLRHPVGFLGPVLDLPLAVAHHVAQLALRRRRHEAAAEQAELAQLGEPLAVAYVRLAARHRLHLLGMDQEERDAALQEIGDGPPVHARRLQRDVRAAGGGEPWIDATKTWAGARQRTKPPGPVRTRGLLLRA